jgi:hypothetical protein
MASTDWAEYPALTNVLVLSSYLYSNWTYGHGSLQSTQIEQMEFENPAPGYQIGMQTTGLYYRKILFRLCLLG